jgi:hypothetical protein
VHLCVQCPGTDVCLSDAYDAYGKHVKSDSGEKKAFDKTRGTKLLETRLKEAGYKLRVLRKGEQAAFEQAALEEQIGGYGAAAGAAARAAGGGARKRGGAAGVGGESVVLIADRRWLPVVHGGDESAAAAAAPRPVSIMGGGLPRTDGAALTSQLAKMFSALGGRFTTHNDEQDKHAGGALVNLVFWLGQQRLRDRNPAAVADADMEEYRAPPQVQITIQREGPASKKQRQQPPERSGKQENRSERLVRSDTQRCSKCSHYV